MVLRHRPWLAALGLAALFGTACGDDSGDASSGGSTSGGTSCTCKCACCVAIDNCDTPQNIAAASAKECDDKCNTNCNGSFSNDYSCS